MQDLPRRAHNLETTRLDQKLFRDDRIHKFWLLKHHLVARVLYYVRYGHAHVWELGVWGRRAWRGRYGINVLRSDRVVQGTMQEPVTDDGQVLTRDELIL